MLSCYHAYGEIKIYIFSNRVVAGRDEPELGSVNVFVVESEQQGVTADNGNLHEDMKPLIVQDDVGLQPTVPHPDTASVVHDAIHQEISGPGSVPFQTPSPFTASGIDQTASGHGEPDTGRPELPKLATGDELSTEGRSGKAEGGDVRRPEGRSPPTEKGGPVAVVAGPRPVVELSCSVVVDFVVGWFESPWIAYLLVVVGSTLLASATEADPAALIVGVLVASAFCFCVFPPPSISTMDDSHTARSPE